MGLSTTVLFSQSLPRTPSVRGVAAGSCPSRPVPSCSSAPGGRRAPCRAHRLTPADDELYQRTRVTVLEPESPNTMFIEGYTSRGFTISGDLVVGPCAILPRAILQWNVGSYRDISRESLSLFRLLEPQIAKCVCNLQLPNK
ncbi:NADH dehydrogenase [ubiquinone] 1 alpha subcomplex assembly factor 3 isoform 3-T3 [Alca torda]